MFLNTFLILLPLFITVLAGFIFSNYCKIDENTLSLILTDFFMPLLVFTSLYKSDVVFNQMLNLIAAVITAFIILFVLSITYCKLRKIRVKEFIFPVCFMNTGFLGFPLMLIWGGVTALNTEVIIDQIQTFILFTFGVIIIKGRANLSGLIQIIKTPLLWAIFCGFIFNFFKISIPSIIVDVLNFNSSSTTVIAAFTVGASIKLKNLHFNKNIVFALLLRFAGGFFAGWVASLMFNLSGKTGIVMIVATSLPSALSSYILPHRYGVNTRDTSNIVVISTIIGIFTIPVSFILATMLVNRF